ncbi:MAG TPA: Holliday junction branch migration protein RuvA [Gemmatimonadaceae bacterium]|jgi:holliday junction DNA helicase RuvA|nr:Holliday junction branch migration protein RuvA [Gemmatimonadaceae bacterium]
MIAQVSGTLLGKELDRVEVMTAGGVAYELSIPLGVYETLPRAGEPVTLHTYLVVKEDAWQLFGFSTPFDRRVFQRVLNAKGVGPALALGLLSTLTGERLVRALRDRDIPTLQSVPRVGRKKAEQLILDLADKLDDLQVSLPGTGPRPEGAGAEDAIRALVSLGYSQSDAERAVRQALDTGGSGQSAAELIRGALGKIRG